MNRLLEALGVDALQWRALTRAWLKLDLRMANMGQSRRSSSKRAVWGPLVFYALMGAFVAIGLSWVGDAFLAGLFVTGYICFMVGTIVLVDHASTLLSPQDHALLGYQPVTSRTYFAARLTNVLVYTLALSVAFGLLPAAVFFVKHGFAIGVAGTFAMLGSAVTVTLTVVTGYVAVARVVGPRRLKNVLGYIQLAFGFVIYGGWFLASEFISRSALATMSVPRTPWLLLYPGTWFAAWIEIAGGGAGALEWGAALLSIAVLVGLALAMRGRLTLDYSERLAALGAAAAPVRAPSKGGSWWFRNGEARAVALLVRSQFRNDNKFRMGVLGILPLTIIYLILGLRDARTEGFEVSNLGTIGIAIILFPVMLKMSLGRSDSFRASWVFFTTPASRTSLVKAAKNVLVVFFVVPYLLAVGVTLAFFTNEYLMVGIFLLLAGLVSHFVLLIATMFDPELPFSKPMAKGSGRTIIGMVVAMSIGGAFLPLLLMLINRDISYAWWAVGGIIALTALMNLLTRVRIERSSARFEFEG